MPFIYDKLFTLLKEKGYSTYKIRKENLISQSALQKMKSGTGSIDTRTLERLCNLLDCQPSDIMEFIPDNEQETEQEREQEKQTEPEQEGDDKKKN